MTFNVLYFAWLRERIGVPSEQVETSAETVSELVEFLRGKEKRYALAFSDTRAVKVAVNQELVDFNTALSGGEEVAFFPPMTGG